MPKTMHLTLNMTSQRRTNMEIFKYIIIAIVSIMLAYVGILYGVDREVARRDYIKKVEICKPIDNCLFSSNCNHYNKMIEQECKKGE